MRELDVSILQEASSDKAPNQYLIDRRIERLLRIGVHSISAESLLELAEKLTAG